MMSEHTNSQLIAESVLANEISRVQQALDDDPYQVGLIVRRGLLKVLLSGKKAIHDELKILERICANRHLVESIARISRSELVIHRMGNLWFCMPEAMGPAETEKTLNRGTDIVSRLSKAFNCPSPTFLFVNIGENLCATTDYRIEGLIYIRIPWDGKDDSRLMSCMVHEMAHAVMPCQHRILAEGIALWAEQQFAVSDGFYRAFQSEQSKPIDAASVPSIEAILGTAFDDQAFFANLQDCRGEKVPALYIVAYRLVRYIIDQLGIARLVSLVNKVNQSEMSRKLFERETGLASDDLMSYILTLGTEAEFESNIDLDELEQSLRRDRVFATDHSYKHYFERMKKQITKKTATDRDLFLYCRIGLSRLYSQLYREGMKGPNPDLLAEVDSISQVLLKRQPGVDSYHLNGRIAGLKIAICASGIEKAVLLNRTRHFLDIAVAKDPSNTELLIDCALRELRTPEEYGGNHQLARLYLDRAYEDPLYRDEVNIIRHSTLRD